jgi:phenylalanyl-tRNA synthetase beta chain
MKISYNWLRHYFPVNLNPEEISEILTGIGLEVEGTEVFQPVKGGLEGVVTGEVISCSNHPDADKLVLTSVDAGAGRILQIVCGAPNVAAGQKVVVALPGATLYMGDRSLTIKKTKIRGVVSEGMICAEDELGLGDSHQGIMVLDETTVPGTPAADYFKIVTDTIFEIGLTPNRIDAASHFGVARDLAAWLGQKAGARLSRPSTEDFRPDNNDYLVEIIIRDRERCKRYSGVSITGVKVEESPRWMKDRLRSIGLKPINNVVDITNYVLHETGQPLHAFDADRIKGRKVVVGVLPARTGFRTLEGETLELSDEDLMICNSDEGMCIAGVLGGMDSGVTGKTVNIFLESACFDPVSIRKTARRHGLATDASFRFERGTDPTATVYALKRAALLIKEIAGGNISSDVVDVYPEPVAPVRIEMDYKYIDRLAGVEIDRTRIKDILERLDFGIIAENGTGMVLEVPRYRVEVTRKADVIEEILRIYGYNKIPTPTGVHSIISFSEKPDREKYMHYAADMLSALGFNEIISNSLTRSGWYSDLPEFPTENLVSIINPLSNDLDSLRQTLLFGGLEAVAYNANRKNPDLKLYEFGNVYSFAGKDNEKGNLDRYSESHHLALFISGATGPALWNRSEKQSDFFDIKAFTELIFRKLAIEPDNLEHDELNNSIFRYGLKVSSGHRILAEYGLVHPLLSEKAGIRNEVYYSVIRWDDLVSLSAEKTTIFQELPRYPQVRRDLALELDKGIRFSAIREIAMKTEKDLLKSISLFDLYEGDKIPEGKKSFAISFILQDREGTLKDKQIDAVMERLSTALQEKAGARIRK